MSLDWRGDVVIRRMQAASRMAIDRTMGEAVGYAKLRHQFTNRTTTAEKSIRIITPARTEGKVTWGMWGSAAVKYFIWLEVGTAAMRAKKATYGALASVKLGIRELSRYKRGARNRGVPAWRGGAYAPTLVPAALSTYHKLKFYVGYYYQSAGRSPA